MNCLQNQSFPKRCCLLLESTNNCWNEHLHSRTRIYAPVFTISNKPFRSKSASHIWNDGPKGSSCRQAKGQHTHTHISKCSCSCFIQCDSIASSLTQHVNAGEYRFRQYITLVKFYYIQTLLSGSKYLTNIAFILKA